MLEGITVLSESVHKFTRFDLIGILVASLIAALLIETIVEISTNSGYFGLGIGLGMFIILFILIYNTTDKSTYNIYKVTISEDINYVEFTDRYEVLSQEGKIYEIREKETE